ncbi:hypothetical protein C8R47DRAFT_1271042 [Mycena vitilis]|nr:hypothetical protein C8R47DRAFT_1271042 [Mycena vitilis]
MHIQCAILHDSLLRSTAPHARRTNAITLPAAWTSAPRLQSIDTIIRSARLSSRGRAAVGWEWEADVTPQGEAAGLPISKSSPGAKNEMPEEDDVREKHISRPKQALRDADEATDVYFHSRRNCPPPSPNRTAVLSPNQRCPAHARQRDAREQLATPAHRAARSLALPLRAKPSGRCAIAASLSAHASSVLSPSRSDPSLPSSLKSAVPIRQRDMQMDVELRAKSRARDKEDACISVPLALTIHPSLGRKVNGGGGGGGGCARLSSFPRKPRALALARTAPPLEIRSSPRHSTRARIRHLHGVQGDEPRYRKWILGPASTSTASRHTSSEIGRLSRSATPLSLCPTSVSQNRSDRRKAAKARPSYNRAP